MTETTEQLNKTPENSGTAVLFNTALENRAHEYGVILTSAINFSADIVKACQMNTCGYFNKCWTCPPAVGTLEELKEKILAFDSAFVFTTMGKLEDSFDFEGMQAAKEYHSRLTGEIHEKFGKTFPVYGAGACTACTPCAYPQPCRFPDKAYLSVEAAGINVTELSRAAKIHYNNGKNTVTYFSMILFNQCNG